MAEAFIKLYKKMLDWEWYDDTNTLRVFLHCLLKANYQAGSWHGINYGKGEFITSLQTLSDETHLSIQQVRTALSHLYSTRELTSRQQGKARIITICKWDEYQGANKVSNNEITRCQQDANKMLTTDKEYKEIKEDKEIKNKKPKPVRHKYGLYQNVLLSDEDMEKLKKEFPTDYQERIERVSGYCKSKGKTYSDYLATIRNWARKENNGSVARISSVDEEERNREIDEHFRRVQAGEFDDEDEELRRMWE